MVSTFSTDASFPSFHAIAAHFFLTKWEIQQVLTAYMLPFSLMPLVHGPLSDSIGRRPVIVGGLLIYVSASIGCTLAPNFAFLLLFRALQGMSAGVGPTVARALVRDLYEGPEAQRLLSLIAMLFAFGPAVAPVIGGWLEVTAGWRSVFAFMAVAGGALAIGTHFGLPETDATRLKSNFDFGEILRRAGRVAAHRELLLLAASGGTSYASVTTFIGAAPAVVVDHWHLTTTQFAWLFGPIIAGFILGACLSAQMAGRLAPGLQTQIGFLVSFISGATMVALHALSAEPPVVLQQALLAIMAVGAQLVAPVLILRTLDLFPQARGSAGAVQACISLAVTATVFGALVPILETSVLTLAEGSFAATLVAIALWRLADKEEMKRKHIAGPRV